MTSAPNDKDSPAQNDTPHAKAARREFVRLMIEQEVLQFGDFLLKSGRKSPYFFNLGKVADARGLAALGDAYAAALTELRWSFEVLFGPAYKGIPIVSATGCALSAASSSLNPGIAYNRKEAKDHGEGGQLVGAEIRSRRVVVLDDVLTAGTAVREALALIKAGEGQLTGVLVALDRQERVLADGDVSVEDGSGITAIGTLMQELGVPVRSIVRLQDVIDYLDSEGTHSEALAAILNYRNAYCVY
jgi:orotate phosphoribosyltransferase